MLGALSPDEATGLLQRRLRLLEQRLAAQRASLAHVKGQVPRLFLVESEYDLAMREAEAAWVRSLLAELTSGEFPDLAQWRAFHSVHPVGPSSAIPGAVAEGRGRQD